MVLEKAISFMVSVKFTPFCLFRHKFKISYCAVFSLCYLILHFSKFSAKYEDLFLFHLYSGLADLNKKYLCIYFFHCENFIWIFLLIYFWPNLIPFMFMIFFILNKIFPFNFWKTYFNMKDDGLNKEAGWTLNFLQVLYSQLLLRVFPLSRLSSPALWNRLRSEKAFKLLFLFKRLNNLVLNSFYL